MAAQNIEREKKNLERITVEAEQARTQAKRQADAQSTLRESGGLSAEYLQYLAITKWQGQIPTYWGSGPLPFINIP